MGVTQVSSSIAPGGIYINGCTITRTINRGWIRGCSYHLHHKISRVTWMHIY